MYKHVFVPPPVPVEPIIQTILTIYGRSEEEVLKMVEELGYEPVALRECKKGEKWLSTSFGEGSVITASHDYHGPDNVRLVIKKKLKRYLNEVLTDSYMGKVFDVVGCGGTSNDPWKVMVVKSGPNDFKPICLNKYCGLFLCDDDSYGVFEVIREVPFNFE